MGVLDLGSVDLTPTSGDPHPLVSTRRGNPTEPVAIVGMSGRAGRSEDLAAFWQTILGGDRDYAVLSKERQADVAAYLQSRGVNTEVAPERWINGARMRSVAEFDHRFFGMSKQEAKLTDPNQRIFLETAWAALEDAGELNSDLAGRRVGVWVGLSTDFGPDYRSMIQAAAPDAPELAVAGNVKSIIGSRLAYLLDLKGPSMLVDTACSSGLVAIHQAMRALQRGDVTMAVVGAVKCDLAPLAEDGSGVGIMDIRATEASDHHTRTFDGRCDGTCAAEGCFVFVLKPLSAAQRDNNTIRAVIMGGAVNQDGASNGITAPDAAAQADLITDALADANVSPEQIGFIEAHGTATPLGDPVEVAGISRAFAARTSRRQFCGIGTVKTNYGHLDNAAGLAGLAKLVLSIENRVLPASLNFRSPNPQIDFLQSPLYVNDSCTPWEAQADGHVYAGINSFGLSGTNCHLVVRSAPAVAPSTMPVPASRLLPLSAPDHAGLMRLIRRYRDDLATSDLDLDDVAWTAGTGRLHFPVRAGIVFSDHADLMATLDAFLADPERPHASVHLGQVRVVIDADARRHARDITEEEQAGLTRSAAELVRQPVIDHQRLARLYADGADVNWQAAQPSGLRKVPLPTYPFARERCWIDPPTAAPNTPGDSAVIRTPGRDIRRHWLSPEHDWALSEHRVQGVCLLPGTAHVDLIVSTLRELGHESIELHGLNFQEPLAMADTEVREVQVIVEDDTVSVVSCPTPDTWLTHVEATLQPWSSTSTPPAVDLAAIRDRLTADVVSDAAADARNGLEVSARWNDSLQSLRGNSERTEFLVECELPGEYTAEASDHIVHPALLDVLINAANNQYDEQLYLPFSYGVLRLYRQLPARAWAHFQQLPDSVPGQLQVFDVVVTDDAGEIVLTVDRYCIKSAGNLDLSSDQPGFHEEFQALPVVTETPAAGQRWFVVGTSSALRDDVCARLTAAGCEWDLVSFDTAPPTSEYHHGIVLPHTSDDPLMVDAAIRHGMALLEWVATHRISVTAGLTVVTEEATDAGQTQQPRLDQAALLGMMGVAAAEFRELNLRLVDIDHSVVGAAVVHEATATGRPTRVSLRGDLAHEPHIVPAPVMDTATTVDLPHDGIVVISGGTGPLGLALAARLVDWGIPRIALLGSPQGQTNEALLTELQQRAEVVVHRFDLADAAATDAVCRELRANYGRISGVAHLAGRPGAGYLHTKSADTFWSVFRPKAVGAVNLHRATAEDRLDFFWLWSSIASLTFDMGQSDYTAANRVLDALAVYRHGHQQPALSLQWPAWRSIGMAHRLGAVDEDDRFTPVSPDEALDLLRATLTTADVAAVVMPSRMRAQQAVTAPRGSSSETRTVTLLGLADPDDVDQAVADLWGACLDLSEIDAYESFGDLGGNSLLTSHMLKLYDERFPGQMDITDLFRFPTIAEQATCLRERLAPALPTPAGRTSTVEDELDQLLDQLERGDISIEDSQALL